MAGDPWGRGGTPIAWQASSARSVDRPWTSGPWRLAQVQRCRRTFRCVIEGPAGWLGAIRVRRESTANAELVVLAPDMAEAILEWQGSAQAPADSDAFDALAERIRAIGGDR